MLNRNWLWLIARLGVVLILGLIAAIYYFGGGSGEKEFQKSLDAMKQVHGFRASYSGMPSGYRHSELLWEIDCDRQIVHQQQHVKPTVTEHADGSPAQEFSRDEVYVKGHQYQHLDDGGWLPLKIVWQGGSAKWYCMNLAQGTDTNVLPPIATMLKRGILQKGDKKTVNGVRCREWLVTMKGPLANLEHDTVCLGLDDHLPYEMTVDWQYSHSSFSDYNTPIQFDLPEAAVQPASAADGSN
jgi:hypothetical protein